MINHLTLVELREDMHGHTAVMNVKIATKLKIVNKNGQNRTRTLAHLWYNRPIQPSLP